MKQRERKKQMKPHKYRLNVWLFPKTAQLIVGRLWGSGEITREQYERFMSEIDKKIFEKEKRKNKKFEKILAEIRAKKQ